MKKIFLLAGIVISMMAAAQTHIRYIENFDNGWKFILDSVNEYSAANVNDTAWRNLNLPHDWSIEFAFDKNSPTGVGGGALHGGVGWYRKTFTLPEASSNKQVLIDFDGVYMNSSVWVNGHKVGFHPYGYTSFRYNLTPYLHVDGTPNTIAVKVDNSKQPNSRWYSGSGIYRNVWLTITNPVYVDHWGTYVTTPVVNNASATVQVNTSICRADTLHKVTLNTVIVDDKGNKVAHKINTLVELNDSVTNVSQQLTLTNPKLWSVNHPVLYKVITTLLDGKSGLDDYVTPFGIRTFGFDANNGFSLNGEHFKINGVCNHHDLGCLGAAVNRRALERQLEILKGMGVNAIRTSHNPPAPELLNLCDSMGLLVMDEAFDMWKKQKNPYDYHLYWDEWHEKDLRSQVMRDRNHPSVIIWSIGNEIPEQWGGKNGEDSSGKMIARELADIVRSLDTTRPITAANNNPEPPNMIIESGALDLIGYNYHHQLYAAFPQTYPGKKFIATETVSALETRGHYDMPSDSIRRWPVRWDIPFNNGNPDLTCSAYDNCSAPWGSTHEETWKVIKKYNFLSGQFIWTGFDYLGEPTPYGWPARSSYFGIVDLAGFPKDIYYMYKSEWTNEPVLHIFPHWNWKVGDTVDVWAYYNHADEVELFLNGKSLGKKHKEGDSLHVWWRVVYQPGTLKAISTENGKTVLTQEIKTAGAPAKIVLKADRNTIHADGKDLSFVTVTVVDKDGNTVPYADNLIYYNITGQGSIVGLDNGQQTDLEPFKGTQHKTFNGLGLCVVQSNGAKGDITLQASADGLQGASIVMKAL
ncbi:glycoside hydrolase family 2 protein [Ilyomonas limi]|uniref:Glycoside hydrolase family 2 protein n=1 Tax=Ilyomonas limi TaxID=2575867 RepID=A0A4U3L6X0_9BACT|nr:beta-galactosidase GalB [Ilyomonas limi]TKK70189.1 glycoside hydrolase family 2 protein [Ilyomonas limi]